MAFDYPRGSEWRKWDLHIHTPKSILKNQFWSDFDQYVKILFKKAIENNIAVIGITDYFCIEWYKKIKQEYLNNQSKLEELFSREEIEAIKKITLLPNIELRLNKLVEGNRINFHVIFSEEVSVSHIEESFLHELDFLYEGDPFNNDQKRKLKLNNLEELWRKLKEEHPKFQQASDLFVGMKCAVIDDTQCSEILQKSIFKNKYLLFIPADEDLSHISRDGQDHLVRKVIIQKSNWIFSSNAETIKWGLWLKHPTKKDFIKEFLSIKPCIHWSDAHSYEELFKPACNRFCWIKADPNFEWLKQIIYEPERVKIQELIPEGKQDYMIIDKIKFLDDVFEPKEIFLNQGLNSIIGGKSTGKSILLRNIAQTIDPEEVKKRLKEVKLSDYKNEVQGFCVTWRDGRIDKKWENPSEGWPRKIIYIPQSYLNRLVDSKEEKTSIDEIILNVLKKESTINDVFLELENKKREIEKNITNNIQEILYIIQDWHILSEQIKDLGDKQWIKKEIEKHKTEVEILKKNINITNEEVEAYNTYKVKNLDLQKKISILNQDISLLNNLLDISIISFPPEVSLMIGEFSEQVAMDFRDMTRETIEAVEGWLRQKIKLYIDWLITKKTELRKEQEQIELDIKSLSQKFEASISLKEKLKHLEVQEQRLELVENGEKKLLEIKEKYTNSIESIIENHSKFYDLFLEIKNKLLNQWSITEESGLNFDIEVLFEEKRYQEDFIESVINRSKLVKDSYDYLQSHFEWNIAFKQHIRELLKGLLNRKLVTKNGYDATTAIKKLTQCWYRFHYNISEGDDSLADMSPGKKSSVLLKLLIQLDSSQCPILLDQPEDDLDNRSIYDDLVSFIKEKKKSRQIIIATHNPNLVVWWDSECIIVANQSWKNSINRSAYRFEYVEWSLENTFLNLNEPSILYKQGIQEHVCEILEWGEDAFDQRKKQYSFIK